MERELVVVFGVCFLDYVLKYCKSAFSEAFATYGEELANAITYDLKKEVDKEQKMVEQIAGSLNGRKSILKDVELSTYACFIHGPRSMVEFEIPGIGQIKKELGDLLLVLTICGDDYELLRKATFVQVKMAAKKRKRVFSWAIDQGQLYLSSRFPRFRPAQCPILPRSKEYHIRNISGSLGSYALFSNCGSMIWIASEMLEMLFGPQKGSSDEKVTINNKEIAQVYRAVNMETCDRKAVVLDRIFSYGISGICSHGFCPASNFLPLGCSLISANVHNFVDSYLKGFIGETVYFAHGFYNCMASNLVHDIIAGLESWAKGKRDTLAMEVLKSFKMFKRIQDGNERSRSDGEEVDMEYALPAGWDEGGIGLVHTVIRLKHS